MKRVTSIILAIIISLSVSSYAFAADEVEDEDISTTIVTLEPDAKELQLEKQEDGSYVGVYEIADPQEASKYTLISVTLTGNVASVKNKYVLDFHWTGTAQVGTIVADTISVKNTSILSPDEYFYTEDYSRSCGGTTSGSRSAGVFNIPEDVTRVRVKTTGLSAYLLDGATWYTSPSINKTYSVNQ